MARIAYLGLAVAVFVLDRWTKVLVEKLIPLYYSHPIIDGFFDLTHSRNTGVAFGFFADSNRWWMPYVLTVVSAVALVVIVSLSVRQPVQDWKLQGGLMLVLGGAVGNLYDRVNYGYVIDFLDVYYGTYHWPTFNVADSAITCGIGLLLLEVVFQKPRLQENRLRPQDNQRIASS
ncbi:MAG: signal peptidase II [Acidobacteriota bacterium]